MQEQYEAPELQLVGEATEVVLGALGVGVDFGDQVLIQEMEFEAD